VLGKDGLNLIQEIGRKISEVIGEERAARFIIQRISIILFEGGTWHQYLGPGHLGKNWRKSFFFSS